MGFKRPAFYQMFQTMADKNTGPISLHLFAEIKGYPHETLINFYWFLSFNSLIRPSTPFFLISLEKLER